MTRSIFTVCFVLLYSQLTKKIIFHHVNWEHPLADSIGKSPSDEHYMHWLTPWYDSLIDLCILAHSLPLNCDIVTFILTYNTIKAISGLFFQIKYDYFYL